MASLAQIQNFFKATLTAPVPLATTVGKFYVSVQPSVSSGYLVISGSSAAKREIIYFDAAGSDGSGPYVNVPSTAERGIGGTTAQAHESGESVRMNVTAQHWADMIEALGLKAGTVSPTFTGTVTVPAPSNPTDAATMQFVLDTAFGVPVTLAYDAQNSVGVAGEALAARDYIYFKQSDQRWWKATEALVAAIPGAVTGFAAAAVASAGSAVTAVLAGKVAGFSGLTAGAPYYAAASAGAITTTPGSTPVLAGWAKSATELIAVSQAYANYAVARAVSSSAGAADEGKLPKLNPAGQLDPSFFKAPVVRVYDTALTNLGDSTTRFDITVPVAGTARYTWDATGLDPAFSLANNPVGSLIVFQAQNFNAANNGVFVVTGAGSNYVEVANVSAVAENDKTVGTGYIGRGSSSLVWAKPSGLSHIVVELVAGGGRGGNTSTGGSTAGAGGSGGAGGGASRKLIAAASLPASVGVEVCPGATASLPVSTRRSSFGSFFYATGGGDGGSEGTAPGVPGMGFNGDVNFSGNGGGQGNQEGTSFPAVGGHGGGSIFGGGAPTQGFDNANGLDGFAYGGGGSGATSRSASTSRTGGQGFRGAVIVTEYYN